MKADKTADSNILLLDIGNTNLKWAWLNDACLGDISGVSHRGQDIAALASQTWPDVAVPDRVYISSVAGQELDGGLRQWMQRRWGIDPDFIRATAVACGVRNSYPEPERLGVDRWLSMLALHTRFPGPACVVDCGTAVTIDVIGPEGRHLGGLILPGFGLMRQALATNTSIPFTGGAGSGGLLATDTEAAIAAGGVHAVAALVDRIMCEVTAECGVPIELVLTGGDARVLQSALGIPCRIESDLVLQGLIEIIRDGTD